eukprot:1141463-Pelagomonas_calceolata.AAC.8
MAVDSEEETIFEHAGMCVRVPSANVEVETFAVALVKLQRASLEFKVSIDEFTGQLENQGCRWPCFSASLLPHVAC